MNIDEIKYSVRLLEVTKNHKDIYNFKFSKPDVDWQEGTNVHLAFEDYDQHEKKKYVRHFSITNLHAKDYVAFTTRHSDSPFKKRLLNLNIGDTMVMYKFQQRMPLRYENRPLVFLSMGLGLVAFNTAIETLKIDNQGIQVTNINISNFEFINQEAYTSLAFLSNHYLTTRADFHQRVMASYDANSIYYLVGCDAFIESMILKLKALGHNPNLIEMDKKADKKIHLRAL